MTTEFVVNANVPLAGRVIGGWRNGPYFAVMESPDGNWRDNVVSRAHKYWQENGKPASFEFEGCNVVVRKDA